MLQIIMLVLLSFTLVACSSEDANTNQQPKVEKNNNKDHMLSDQEKMLEKARKAEEAIQEADEKRRKALEDQGG